MMKNYLSLIKFSHTIFAMPFALIGFFLACQDFEFEIIKLFYVITCMILARSSAMAFNRYIDREIDKKNIRTAEIREIPNGTIKAENALIFVIINSLLFVIVTYFINTICFYLSPVALLIILGYSYTKRFTSLCHIILGLGLSLSPIGAYLAVAGQFDLTPLLMSFLVLFWVSGFDIIYSLQDKEFDENNNLNSIPVLLGVKKGLWFSRFLHLIAIVLIIVIGSQNNFQYFYWIGSLLFIGLLFLQHSIIKEDDFSKINIAFFTTNGVASIIFCVFVLLDIFIN